MSGIFKMYPWMRTVIFTILGAAVGLGYYLLIGCRTGG